MIVYLHGFSSAAASHKAGQLRRALSEHSFLIADYPSHRPHAAIAGLRRLIGQADDVRQAGVTLIGSSLGGFYARYLGEKLPRVVRVVLINPALRPWLTLAPYVGANINCVTGEPFRFDRTDLAALDDYRIERLQRPKPTLVLLDADDEVLDARVAGDDYAACGKVVCYPGGSHRFEHVAEAVEEIRAFLTF